MIKYLYNPSLESITLCGQMILSYEYYEIPFSEEGKFANSSDVLSAITNENTIVIDETIELNNTYLTLEEVISSEKYSSCDDDSNLENSNRVVLEYTTDADESF